MTKTVVFANAAQTIEVACLEALIRIVITAPTSFFHGKLPFGALFGCFLRDKGIFVCCFVTVANAIRSLLYLRIIRASSVSAAMSFLIVPRTHVLASLAVPKLLTHAFADIIALSVSGTNSSCHHAISIFTITRIRKFSDVVFGAYSKIIFFCPNRTRVLALDSSCSEWAIASR